MRLCLAVSLVATSLAVATPVSFLQQLDSFLTTGNFHLRARDLSTPAAIASLMARRCWGDASTGDDPNSSSSTLVASGLVNFLVYALFLSIFAWWYYACDGKKHFALEAVNDRLVGNKKTWSFGLFQCCDEPALCCLSCCCGAVRWADTMTMAFKMWFVAAFTMYLIIFGLDFFALPGSVLLACLCAMKRQELRKLSSLPYGSCGTCLEDFCTYLCCTPCAIVQEARQVEAQFGSGVGAVIGISPDRSSAHIDTATASARGGVNDKTARPPFLQTVPQCQSPPADTRKPSFFQSDRNRRL